MDAFAVMWDWVGFAVRWLHVITGIAWIGSSFYFIALDLGLRKSDDLPDGVHGEEWQVHGGGFYHIRKYLVAPDALPDHLTWFKWESYATWLSGFALLIIVYYLGADLYLIDRAVLDISTFTAIGLSLAVIAGGWLFYDFLCKSPLGHDNTRLMVLLYGLLVLLAWGLTHIFSGRAAFIHLGALTATIMSANVFLIIIPNQKIVVADLKAGRTPDAKYGVIAKQRSTHNNYLTLPVLFLMLSNHYPLAFATQHNWVIASLVFLMGVTIRHYFNSLHARRGNPTWTWLVTALLFIIIMWLSTVPRAELEPAPELTTQTNRFMKDDHFPEIVDIISTRCTMCHAAEPAYEGLLYPPRNVVLESENDVARSAKLIYLWSGKSHAMPPSNISLMQPQERRHIVRWYESATK